VREGREGKRGRGGGRKGEGRMGQRGREGDGKGIGEGCIMAFGG